MNLARLSTGIIGFDEILTGGLIQKRAYLVRGVRVAVKLF